MLAVIVHRPEGLPSKRLIEDEGEATRVAAELAGPGLIVEVLGGTQPCNQCGECCRVATRCEFRAAVGRPLECSGPCDLLRENADGTAICKVIERLAVVSPLSLPLYGIDGVCNFPYQRKELACGSHS